MPNVPNLDKQSVGTADLLGLGIGKSPRGEDEPNLTPDVGSVGKLPSPGDADVAAMKAESESRTPAPARGSAPLEGS